MIRVERENVKGRRDGEGAAGGARPRDIEESLFPQEEWQQDIEVASNFDGMGNNSWNLSSFEKRTVNWKEATETKNGTNENNITRLQDLSLSGCGVDNGDDDDVQQKQQKQQQQWPFESSPCRMFGGKNTRRSNHHHYDDSSLICSKALNEQLFDANFADHPSQQPSTMSFGFEEASSVDEVELLVVQDADQDNDETDDAATKMNLTDGERNNSASSSSFVPGSPQQKKDSSFTICSLTCHQQPNRTIQTKSGPDAPAHQQSTVCATKSNPERADAGDNTTQKRSDTIIEVASSLEQNSIHRHDESDKALHKQNQTRTAAVQSRGTTLKRAMSSDNVEPPPESHNSSLPVATIRRGRRRPITPASTANSPPGQQPEKASQDTGSTSSTTDDVGSDGGGTETSLPCQHTPVIAQAEEEEESIKLETSDLYCANITRLHHHQRRDLRDLLCNKDEPVTQQDFEDVENRRLLHYLMYRHHLNVDFDSVHATVAAATSDNDTG